MTTAGQGSRRHIDALDGLRGLAAVYVFLYHARVIPLFGQEMVILFFILSGFVIHYVTHAGNHRTKITTYLAHRVRRIYPLYLVALITAYVAAAIALHTMPDPRWKNFFQNVAMLQGLTGFLGDFWALPYWENAPLWSLSFEWWFYMLFIPLSLMGLVSETRQFLLVAVLSIVAFFVHQLHPGIVTLVLNYFVIWWFGVELSREYRATGAITLRNQIAPVVVVGICTALWGALALRKVLAGGTVVFGAAPILQARQFGAAFVFILAGFTWKQFNFRYFRYIIGPFAAFAPISYALYILHYPVLRVVRTLVPGSIPIIQALVAIAILVPLCYVLEVVGQKKLVAFLSR
ncbi:MAG: hypothetical protein JWM95_5503 [Gemmatimonadetes bacterium]|nr:hypothetical protein [Gemmatimonadota bacterium]